MGKHVAALGMAVAVTLFGSMAAHAAGYPRLGVRSEGEMIMWADQAALKAVGGGQVTSLSAGGHGPSGTWIVGITRGGARYQVTVSRAHDQVLAVRRLERNMS